MSHARKTFLSWSSGKDAALALYHLLKSEHYDVRSLLTSVNKHHDRVSMHGLRRSLLEQQVKSIGLPCTMIELPEQPDMNEYEQRMNDALKQFRQEGYTHAAFGDIFLEDLRTYRENQLKAFELEACFPIWQHDTTRLIHEFVGLGFKAVVVCVNSSKLDASFAGREIDHSFLQDLPDTVDPCGENGEFHTFCYDGPIFSHPVQFELGEKVYREYKTPGQQNQSTGFWFCDVLPVGEAVGFS